MLPAVPTTTRGPPARPLRDGSALTVMAHPPNLQRRKDNRSAPIRSDIDRRLRSIRPESAVTTASLMSKKQLITHSLVPSFPAMARRDLIPLFGMDERGRICSLLSSFGMRILPARLFEKLRVKSLAAPPPSSAAAKAEGDRPSKAGERATIFFETPDRPGMNFPGGHERPGQEPLTISGSPGGEPQCIAICIDARKASFVKRLRKSLELASAQHD